MGEMSNRLVSIIVVTKGAKDYIDFCLNSTRTQAYTAVETIVIDNLSDENASYCSALNKGIRLSKGDFVLCLNDDVVLHRDFITEAIKCFDLDPRMGMVSGKVLRQDAKTIDTTGLFLSCWRTAKERGYGAKDRGQFEKPGYIFGVCGAAAFYRREMLEHVKLESEYFDTDFRFFYEDLDIAWRANNLGWRGYYNPKAVAYHVRGGTARENKGLNKKYARLYLSDRLFVDLVKNRYLTIIKNESIAGFLLHLPCIIAHDVLAWGYILFFKFPLIKDILSKLALTKSAFRKRRLSAGSPEIY
jgi:GT2 family glycosyltransferase